METKRLTLMNSRSSKTKTWNMTIRIVTMAAVLALCRGQAHKSHTQKDKADHVHSNLCMYGVW